MISLTETLRNDWKQISPMCSERPLTVEDRGSVGGWPLTRPSATLSPQTGEGRQNFDQFLNFGRSK